MQIINGGYITVDPTIGERVTAVHRALGRAGSLVTRAFAWPGEGVYRTFVHIDAKPIGPLEVKLGRPRADGETWVDVHVSIDALPARGPAAHIGAVRLWLDVLEEVARAAGKPLPKLSRQLESDEEQMT